MASSLIVNLGLNAAEFVRGLTKAEAQVQGLVTATAKQSAAIDRNIKALERQAATVGMTTREIKLYELAQRGATTAQLAQAGAALRTVENFERMQKAARGLGVVLGTLGIGSILGFVTFAKSVLDGIDALDDLKDATGSTIENISALEDVARRAGEGFEVVETALVRMNKVLNDTEDGKKAANIIKGLGLEIQTLRTLDPAEAMRQLAVAFSKFADDGAKGRAFLELFGKSAKDIAPFMADLAKQTQLVGSVTAEQAAEVKKFREAIFGLQKDVLDLARALSGPLLASTQQFVRELTDIIRNSDGAGEAIRRLIALGQQKPNEAAGAVLNFFGINQSAEQKIASLQSKIAKLGDTSKNAWATQQLKDYQAELATLTSKSSRAVEAVTGFAKTANSFGKSAGGGRGFVNPDMPARSLGNFEDNKKPDKIAKTVSEAQRYLETLQKQAEKTQELTILEQTLLDIQKGRIEGLTPKLKEQIILAAKEADARKQTVELLKSEQTAREAVAKMVQAANAAAAAETTALETGNEALRTEIELLGADEVARAAINNAIAQSLITRKEEQLLMERNSALFEADTTALEQQIALLKEKQRLATTKADIENFQGVKKSAEDAFKENEHIKNSLADSIEEGILDGFRRSESITKIFLNELKAQFGKTILRPIIAPIAEAGNQFIGLLLQGLAGVISGSGGGGGTTGDFSRMDRGQSIGREVPMSMNKVQAGGMAGTQITNHNQFGSNISHNELAAWGEMWSEKTKSDIMQLQRGGHFQNA